MRMLTLLIYQAPTIVINMRRDELDRFKTERKVFDKKTLFALYKLLDKGILATIESEIKEGKESVVFSAKNTAGQWLAVKVYRTKYCDFKSMWKYLMSDPRFPRVRKSRRVVINNWCRREFGNLKIAHETGVSCPKPIAFMENVLVMSFIGKNGVPAPKLSDIRGLSVRSAKRIYNIVLKDMEKLAKARLVHADLSAYNILLLRKPYLIDFSQAVNSIHPLVKEFLLRDVKNVNRYFERFIEVVDEKKIFERLLSLLS